MQSILIVKTSAIGDVIQTFPVLEYMRRRFPDARIDWAVEKGCADLLKAHPLLDHVLIADTKVWRKGLLKRETWKAIGAFGRELREIEYDLLIDLQGNSKSALITGAARAKEKVGFGPQSVPEKPNLLVTRQRYEVPRTINVRERYLQIAKRHFKDEEPFVPQGFSLKVSEDEQKRLNELLDHPFLESGPRWMVAFGSKWKNKRLKEEALKRFLSLLSKTWHPSFLFVWGSEEERLLAVELQNEFPQKSLAVGQLSLPLWQALMVRMDAVIAMDSAALHLSATTPTPSFSVFGPSLASIYKPLDPKHQAFQGACPYGRVFEHRCPVLRTCPTGACIRDLSAEALFESFSLWIDKSSPQR